MRRRASILAYCLAIVLVLLGLQSWGIAVGHVEQRVIAAIEDRAGLKVTGLERAEITLLPLPRITLSQVAFTQRDRLIGGTAARITARARLLPLLSGRFDFDRLDLSDPQIDIAVGSARDEITDLLSGPLAYLAGLRSQSKIIITGGSLFMRAQGTIDTILRDVNLVIDERDAGEPLNVSGSLRWRGVLSDVSLIWPMAGARARVALRAASPVMSLQFEGIRSGVHEPVINGKLSLSTRSASELLGWFGEKPLLSTALGALDLSGEAQIKPNELALANLVASLDGERLDGAIKLGEVNGRQSLSGTLAGASLDIGRLVERLEPAPGRRSDETAPLPFESWTAHDIDLRISVDQARMLGARLTDVATYLLVRKGRFETGLLRASAYGGSAKARLLATAAPGGIDVKLQAGLDKVALGQATADLPGLGRLSGAATLQLALDGLGTSPREVVTSLSGKANATLRQGEIAGFAFADLLRRAERSPALALRDWRQGKTAFDTASLNATITNGVVSLSEGLVSGASYRLAVTGQASLPARWIDLSGQLAPLTGALRLPFSLRGPFGEAALELDGDALLLPSRTNGTTPPVTR